MPEWKIYSSLSLFLQWFDAFLLAEKLSLDTAIFLNIEKSSLGVPLFISVPTLAVKLFITVTVAFTIHLDYKLS